MNNKRLFTTENAGYSINRIKLLRILLDGKVQCYACERKYASDFVDSPKRMDRLQVSDWIVTVVPEKLTIELKCGYCEHKGLFNMEPNPFMDTNNIDKYAALLMVVAGKE